MTLHTTIKTAAAAAALSFAATAASAETYNWANNAGVRAGVTITAAPVPVLGNDVPGSGTPVTQGVNAGTFELTGGGYTVLDPLIAWCFDVSRTIVAGDYTDTLSFLGGSNYVSDALDRVQRVFDANYDVFEDAAGFTNANRNAAFQLAIWEAIYDDGWTLAAGAFQATANLTITNFANTFLAAASAPDIDRKWNIIELTGVDDNGNPRTTQNLGTVSVIPVPAGALLILSAVGLAAGVRRYGRSA